jgi:hypothetical protein
VVCEDEFILNIVMTTLLVESPSLAIADKNMGIQPL